MTNDATPGRRGYRAFGDHMGWRNWDGTAMPPWDRLPEKIRGGWEAQARAIIAASQRVKRNDALKIHFNQPSDLYTLCGMVRGGLLVTTDSRDVTCGRCKHSIRIRRHL